MNKYIEEIYYRSPTYTQNIFASIQGYFLERSRHGGNYKKYLNVVESRKRWTKRQFVDFQNKKLKKLLKHAVKNIPFYAKLYKKYGISIHEINSLEDIEKLPIITKKDVRENLNDLIDKRKNGKRLLRINTTGTTGTPLTIFCDNDTRRRNYAFFDAFQKTLNINHCSKRATLGGRIIVPYYQKKPPFWRYSYFQKNLLFSSYHLNDDNIPHYIKKLNSYKAEVIDAYPSSIYTISNFIIKNNIQIVPPKAVITSGETLFDDQKTIIEDAFKCKVYDQYGAAEMCIFSFQCERGNYHIRPDYGIVENVKKYTKNGSESIDELICTGFINWVMPLIRYEIGDSGTIKNYSCPCGFESAIIDKIQGRIDDFIYTKSGTPIGRLSPVMKGFKIKESVFIQKKIGQIKALIVKDDGFKENDPKLIEYELRKRVGNDMEIEIELVNKIDKICGSKNRNIISEINNI